MRFSVAAFLSFFVVDRMGGFATQGSHAVTLKKIWWLHIPKCSSSFGPLLLRYACPVLSNRQALTYEKGPLNSDNDWLLVFGKNVGTKNALALNCPNFYIDNEFPQQNSTCGVTRPLPRECFRGLGSHHSLTENTKDHAITILRNPKAHLTSYIAYSCLRRGHRYFAARKTRNLLRKSRIVSSKKSCIWQISRIWCGDIQSRFLSGQSNFEVRSAPAAQAEKCEWGVSHELAQRAIMSLKRFVFFGLLECWSSSVELFEKTVGVSNLIERLDGTVMRETPQKSKLEASALVEKIYPDLNTDEIVYEWAKRVFCEKLENSSVGYKCHLCTDY